MAQAKASTVGATSLLRSRRFWLGITLTSLFLVLFAYRLDLGDMARVFREANYLYLVPGAGCYFVALWLRTLRWKVILLPLEGLPVPRLWPILIIGYAANNLLPIRLGELIRAYFLGTASGVSKSAGLATIVVERVFDGLALLLLVVLVSPLFSLVGLFQELGERVHVPWLVLTLGLSIPFFTLSALFILLAVLPNLWERTATRALAFLPVRFRMPAREVVLNFLAGLSALRRPRLLIIILALSLPVWLAEAAMYFVIALGFGIQDSFDHWGLMVGAMVLGLATSNLGTAIPSSSGGVGPFEFFLSETFQIIGVQAAAASAFAITVHVTLMAPVTSLGLVYLWTRHMSLLRLARASRE